MEVTGFFVDAQDLDLVSDPVINPFKLVSPHERRIEWIEVTLRPFYSGAVGIFCPIDHRLRRAPVKDRRLFAIFVM